MQAGTLHCPTCGAVVSKDAPQCQYCHALLQTVACLECMGMMFLGSKFCPHCGAVTKNISPGPATVKSCPRCKAKLQQVRLSKWPLDECTRCGGLWVEVASFDKIVSDAEARTAATGLQLPPPVVMDTKVLYIHCPVCDKLMNRVNYAGRSGVIIDICRAHGIWLDRDEIRQIIEFISTGGLDRARQIESDQIARDRRALEAEQRIPPPMGMEPPGSYYPYTEGNNIGLFGSVLFDLIDHFFGQK